MDFSPCFFFFLNYFVYCYEYEHINYKDYNNYIAKYSHHYYYYYYS